MAKTEYKILVIQKARKMLRARILQGRTVIFWLLMGLLIFWFLRVVPGLDLKAEIGIPVGIFVIANILFYLDDRFYKVPAEIDDERTKEINRLKRRLKKESDGAKQANFELTPSDELQDGISYISILISNHEPKMAKCHAVLAGVEIDGKEDEELFQTLTRYTPRISWAGGSDEENGIKDIDPGVDTGVLNIATLKNLGALVFEMAKGSRGNRLKLGRYDIMVELRGTINDDSFKEIHKTISFEYYDSGGQFTGKIGQGLTLKGREIKRNIRLIKKDKK